MFLSLVVYGIVFIISKPIVVFLLYYTYTNKCNVGSVLYSRGASSGHVLTDAVTWDGHVNETVSAAIRFRAYLFNSYSGFINDLRRNKTMFTS